MIRRPAGRFLTMPFPPFPFAARLFAAVILPPRLFLAMLTVRLRCILSCRSALDALGRASGNGFRPSHRGRHSGTMRKLTLTRTGIR
jgi:hypothetical protein